jgi:hypothetical protein
MIGMMTAEEWSAVARTLAAECARLGFAVPAFRSPCPVAGHDRSIRRYPGQTVVKVSFQGREPIDVTSDLIDGCIAAQGDLEAPTVDQLRSALWIAAGEAVTA